MIDNNPPPEHIMIYGPFKGQTVASLSVEYLETILEVCDPEDISLFEAAHYWYKRKTGRNWRDEG